MDLIKQFRDKATALGESICLPEALQDQRVMKAAGILRDEGIARPIVIGPPGDLAQAASQAGITLDGIECIDIATYDRLDEMISLYGERRAKENLTEQQIREVLSDVIFFGAMLVQTGVAEGMTTGAAHATGHVVRASIKCIGAREGIKTISSAFLMILPETSPMGERVFTFSDCAFVPQPDPGQLADIAEAAADTHRRLAGEEPRVALLSYSTKGSADSADTQKVLKALEIIKSRSPELKVDGELQLDAAVVESVGKKKAPDSDIAGTANVLVFPDLDAANIGYKLVQRMAGAEAVGPVSQGLAKPVNDLSRGCSVDDVVNVAAITILQS